MREILSYMTIDDDFFRLPKNTAYRTNTLRVSPKYAWVREEDSKTGEHVGNSARLKDAPKFITWFPEVQTKTDLEMSNAHIKAYQKYIDNFYIYPYFANVKKDKSSTIEVKKYNSFGV